MEIRELGAAERVPLSLPMQAYAFQATPPNAELVKALERRQRFYAGNLTLVAEEDGDPVAQADALPMRQNVRGAVYPMAGVAGVATLPRARRRGYARALVNELLDRMRDSGHAVAALYPFRASFYQRFGFVGLPTTRTVTFPPAALAGLLRADLPGEVTLATAADGYAAYRAVTERVLAQRHGFSVLPDFRAVELKETGSRWIVTAWAGGEPVAATTYRITGYGGVMAADDLLAVEPARPGAAAPLLRHPHRPGRPGRGADRRRRAARAVGDGPHRRDHGGGLLPGRWRPDGPGAAPAVARRHPGLPGAGQRRGDRRPLHRGRLPARRHLGGARGHQGRRGDRPRRR